MRLVMVYWYYFYIQDIQRSMWLCKFCIHAVPRLNITSIETMVTFQFDGTPLLRLSIQVIECSRIVIKCTVSCAKSMHWLILQCEHTAKTMMYSVVCIPICSIHHSIQINGTLAEIYIMQLSFSRSSLVYVHSKNWVTQSQSNIFITFKYFASFS